MDNTNQPFLSIIISTHLRPKLLLNAIDSIKQQDGFDYEIIVCSDEADDETKKILINNLRQVDSFFICPNLNGPADTRNLGLEVAKGKWVCFLDDDDTFNQNYFSAIYEILKKEKNVVHFFNYTKIFNSATSSSLDPRSEIMDLSNRNIQELFYGNFLPINSYIFPNLIGNKFKFNPKLKSHEDWDFLIQLLMQFEFLHHPINGSNVNLTDLHSRNKISAITYISDYLYIYKSWPTDSVQIKIKRCEALRSLGLEVPLDFFNQC